MSDVVVKDFEKPLIIYGIDLTVDHEGELRLLVLTDTGKHLVVEKSVRYDIPIQVYPDAEEIEAGPLSLTFSAESDRELTARLANKTGGQ